MHQVELNKLKKGDIFRRSATGVEYIRGAWSRGKKGVWPRGYSCTDWHDINREIILNKSTLVWVGFEF